MQVLKGSRKGIMQKIVARISEHRKKINLKYVTFSEYIGVENVLKFVAH